MNKHQLSLAINCFTLVALLVTTNLTGAFSLTRFRFNAQTAGNQPRSAAVANRPNVLWIMADDMGPELSSYGQPLVRTPNLDGLAREGVRFTRAHTTAPVCSPSRSAIATGMYQTSIGAQNHRSHREDGYQLPPGVKVITDYFRQAGYYTVNVKTVAPGVKCSQKTDFNFTAPPPFDGDDWGGRKEGQPFYAQVNFIQPHRATARGNAGQLKDLTSLEKIDNWTGYENELAALPQRIDPAKVTLPPYYPDTAAVRADHSRYLDAINLLDIKVGAVLKRLKDEGLADNTIVFFFGDNGRPNVRDKQWLYDGGTHIPLIVRWPGTAKPGTVNNDLISGIDITATSLRLAGITPPAKMQGRVFLGSDAAQARDVIFTARDRCDETVDRIRGVRSKEYSYIRNYYPERPYTQPNAYKEKAYPALQVMKILHAEGKLTPAQQLFMRPRKPLEELYDLKSDPHEVNNLADSPKHQKVLGKMQQHLAQWMAETKDQGEMPETPDAIRESLKGRKVD